jgi:hypothetical protein
VSSRPGLVFGLAGAVLSLIALANMPYGYYTFDRVALTALAVVMAVIAVRNQVPGWIWGLAPIALLWNPAFPVHLDRATWAPLNVVAAAFFLVCGLLMKRAPSSS